MDVIYAFNAQIASSPPILEAIFQNLSCIHLDVCAQVCKAWRTQATTVKKRRLPEFSYCVLQYHDGKNRWEENFCRHLQDMPFEPYFVLAFVTDRRFCRQVGENELRYSTVNYDNPDWNRICSGSNVNVTQHFCAQLLFSQCYFPTAPVPMKYMLSNHEESGDLSAVFFPTIPGFRIHVAEICQSRFTFSAKAILPAKTKLALILYKKNGSSEGKILQKLELLLTNMQSRKNQKLAMGGALVANVDYSFSNSRISSGLYVLSFIGDNVRAASIVIPPNMQTADSIESKLKGLLDTQIFEGRCIAFAFTCIVRTMCYLKSKGVEYDVFRKLFPSVPLFVAVGENAVGVDYIPNGMKPNASVDSFVHKNSTVFVVVSVRK